MNSINSSSSSSSGLEAATKVLEIGMQAKLELENLFVQGTIKAIKKRLLYKRGGKYRPKIKSYVQEMITSLEWLGKSALMAQDLKRHLNYVLRLIHRLKSTSFAKPAEAVLKILLTLQDVTAEELCYEYHQSEHQLQNMAASLQRVSNAMSNNSLPKQPEEPGMKGTRYFWKLEELRSTFPFTQKYLERFQRKFQDDKTAPGKPTRFLVKSMSRFLLAPNSFTCSSNDTATILQQDTRSNLDDSSSLTSSYSNSTASTPLMEPPSTSSTSLLDPSAYSTLTPAPTSTTSSNPVSGTKRKAMDSEYSNTDPTVVEPIPVDSFCFDVMQMELDLPEYEPEHEHEHEHEEEQRQSGKRIRTSLEFDISEIESNNDLDDHLLLPSIPLSEERQSSDDMLNWGMFHVNLEEPGDFEFLYESA